MEEEGQSSENVFGRMTMERCVAPILDGGPSLAMCSDLGGGKLPSLAHVAPGGGGGGGGHEGVWGHR